MVGASAAKPALKKKPSHRVEALALERERAKADKEAAKEKAAPAKAASEAQMERVETVELAPPVPAPSEVPPPHALPSPPPSRLKPWALQEAASADDEDVLVLRV